jgi:kinesin family member C1
VPARREMGYNKATPRRNVLSALNNAEANGGTPSVPADGGGAAEAAPVIEFSGREDVERLLAEKMKGKSKNDFKVGFRSFIY